MSKVYCWSCEHRKEIHWITGTEEYCCLKYKKYDTPKEPRIKYYSLEKANKNNKCSLHKLKRNFFEKILRI